MKYESKNTPKEKKRIITIEIQKALKTLSNSSQGGTIPSNSSSSENSPTKETKRINNINPRNLNDAKRLLARKIESGTLDTSLVETIFDIDGFLPIEGILIDYKRDIPKTSGAFLKLIKHIQAFHNTYGGYLFLGADEVEKDNLIIPKYKAIEEIDVKNSEIYAANISHHQ